MREIFDDSAECHRILLQEIIVVASAPRPKLSSGQNRLRVTAHARGNISGGYPLTQNVPITKHLLVLHLNMRTQVESRKRAISMISLMFSKPGPWGSHSLTAHAREVRDEIYTFYPPQIHKIVAFAMNYFIIPWRKHFISTCPVAIMPFSRCGHPWTAFIPSAISSTAKQNIISRSSSSRSRSLRSVEVPELHHMTRFGQSGWP